MAQQHSNGFVAGAVNMAKQPLFQAGIAVVAMRCSKVETNTALIVGGIVMFAASMGAGLSDIGAGVQEHGRGLTAIASSLDGVGVGVLGHGSADGLKVRPPRTKFFSSS